jgi:hypothetical protein
MLYFDEQPRAVIALDAGSGTAQILDTIDRGADTSRLLGWHLVNGNVCTVSSQGFVTVMKVSAAP